MAQRGFGRGHGGRFLKDHLAREARDGGLWDARPGSAKGKERAPLPQKRRGGGGPEGINNFTALFFKGLCKPVACSIALLVLWQHRPKRPSNFQTEKGIRPGRGDPSFENGD